MSVGGVCTLYPFRSVELPSPSTRIRSGFGLACFSPPDLNIYVYSHYTYVRYVCVHAQAHTIFSSVENNLIYADGKEPTTRRAEYPEGRVTCVFMYIL
jgi:hypothetical protein